MKKLLLSLALALSLCGSLEATPAFINGASAGGVSNFSTPTPIDCTGATFIGFGAGWFSSFAPGTDFTFGDSSGNSYVHGTITTISDISTAVFYKANPAVSNAMTFSVTGNLIGAFAAECFSGVDTASPFDVQSVGGTQASSLTVQPGALTPSNANSLLLTVYTENRNDGTPTIDSGFAAFSSGVNYTPYAGGSNYACGMSFLVTSSNTNPTVTVPVGAELAAGMSAFKPSGGAVAVHHNLATMGVGR